VYLATVRMSVAHYSLRTIVQKGIRHPALAPSRRIVRALQRRMQRLADLPSARKALLVSEALSGDEKRLLSQVSLRVHPNDDMYPLGTGRHYLSLGFSARRAIMAALAHTPCGPIRAILDLPSGYGRILRFLKVSFPNATIFCACDINAEAVDFCRRQFNASAVVSNTDFAKVSFPWSFDLIWSGSLLTHVSETDAIELLRLFYRSLSPNGLCVFTMHGRTSVAWLESRAETYGLTEADIRRVLSDYAGKGYAYADYPTRPGYGISIGTRTRIIEMASAVGNWSFSSFHERMWSDHHDVYAFSKSSVNTPLIVEARHSIPAPNMFRWVL
jgi:SAM-dependent methyltransferase